MRILAFVVGLVAAISLAGAPSASANDVRIKDLGRFLGWRDNALVGYGIVTGLSGSGDSPRNEVTQQALRNALGRLGASVGPDQVQSRNVAVVMVTATLPPSANVGDKLDVNVTSIGDARSLAGGTLLMTPLLGPDQRSYALAQGQLVVGGYRFESNQNLQQRNHPTAGVISAGATVETSVSASVLQAGNELVFVLRDPDFTTAIRIADSINAALGRSVAAVRDADAISIQAGGPDLFRLIAQIENVTVRPEAVARVVINEKAGTVVAGGGAQISSVVISQGDIRVSVTTDNQAAQPTVYGGYLPELGGLVVSNTRLEVSGDRDAVIRLPHTTVADLMDALSRVNVDTRGKIAVLQGLKAAGALHAELIIQ